MDDVVPSLLDARRPGALCTLCQTVAYRTDGVSLEYPEHHLKISAARGCALCRTLFEDLVCNLFTTSAAKRNLEVTWQEGKVCVVDYINASHEYEIVDMARATTSHTVYRRISSDSRLEPCWQLIEAWLSTCTSSHPACSHDQSPEWPTRLLDVEDLRIVDGQTCEGPVRYATLSHCWGTSMFLRLREDSVMSLMSGIDHSILPRNFQDAIFAARRLKIRYLWIDALCIMQDSHLEWEYEAINMGRYYGHAVVNLSALSSPSSNIGFLGPRNPQPMTSLQNGLHLRKARPSWNSVFTGAPLTERAWILQERLIAPRIIHFSDSEIFWECRTISAREGSTVVHSDEWQGGSWRDESFKRSFALDALLADNAGKSRSEINELIMAQWYRIACQHTSLNLTYCSDIFPAIAAIVQKFREITDFTYNAGMWLEDLHRGLLWYPKNSLSRPEYKEHAPSWSWASRGGPVHMMYPPDICRRAADLDAELIGHSYRQTRLDFSNAELELKAHRIDVWCRSSSDGNMPYSDPYLRMALDIFDSSGIFIGTGYFDQVPEGEKFKCTAIVICGSILEMALVESVYFLLVQRKNGDDADVGRHERVGVRQTLDDTHGHPGRPLDLSEKEHFFLV